jgi:hypothetical protein
MAGLRDIDLLRIFDEPGEHDYPVTASYVDPSRASGPGSPSGCRAKPTPPRESVGLRGFC